MSRLSLHRLYEAVLNSLVLDHVVIRGIARGSEPHVNDPWLRGNIDGLSSKPLSARTAALGGSTDIRILIQTASDCRKPQAGFRSRTVAYDDADAKEAQGNDSSGWRRSVSRRCAQLDGLSHRFEKFV